MFGLLNLDKPAGCTSRAVVNTVQRLVKPAKAGHAGTLDPLATGVLVVCVGPATRLIEYVQRMPKSYRAEFRLGCSSPSDDVETEVSEIVHAPQVELADIEAVLPRLTGPIEQRPPAYSAKKVSGRRAYKLARAGEQLVLPAARVEIYELAIEAFAYPRLQLFVRCSSGAYVRAVGRDLAELLGTGAVMSALQRTAIGGFQIANAILPSDLSRSNLPEALTDPLAAVDHLPRYVVSDEALADLKHGRLFGAPPGEASEYAGVSASGQLVAILRRTPEQLLRPARNFSQAIQPEP